jgi:hypothetical protein
LSPEKLRATKVHPMDSASRQGSIGALLVDLALLRLLPTSAEAENCPLVRPYTPLFSMTYSHVRGRGGSRAQNCPRPMDSVSPSPETPM